MVTHSRPREVCHIRGMSQLCGRPVSPLVSCSWPKDLLFTPLILHSSSCNDSKKCFTAVFDWWLYLAITPHHDVAITTSLMVLWPLSVALCGVELRPLNLGGESLKVCIDDVGAGSCLWWFLKVSLFLPSSGISIRIAVWHIPRHSGLWACSRSPLL